MEYLIILTVQVPTCTGVVMGTTSRTVTVRPEMTRADLLEGMLRRLPDSHRAGNIVFFSAEPNDLTTRRFNAVAGSQGRAE